MAQISTAPMTAGQLLNAARSEANATTAGPLSQLAAQIASQNKQTANATKAVKGYFQGLGNYVNGAATQVGQIGSNLDTQLGGLQTQAQNSLSAYTPKGDADVGAVGMPGLVSALTAQRGLADQQQAGYGDLVNALKGAYSTQGQQDLADIRTGGESAVGNLNTKYNSELGKQASLTDQDLVKLRQQEITNQHYANQDQIDAGALGIKQQSANTTASNDTARNKVSLLNANTAAARSRSTAAYDQGLLGIDRQKANTAAGEAASLNTYRDAEANAKTGTGSKTPLTPNENNTMLNELGKAVAYAKAMGQKGAQPGKITQALTIGGKSVQTLNEGGQIKYATNTIPAEPQAVVQAALEVMQSGQISHQTYTQLHKMGVRNLPFKVGPPKGK